MSKPKIAIVHDWIYGGGAEKVVLEIHKLYPDAPIYTSFCSDEWRERLDNKVITGYLQRWPFSKIRRLLPLLRQWWFAKLDLSGFDIIISSSGNGEAKFVRKSRPDQLHICYCHTPTHFYWRHYEEYIKRPSFRPQWLARLGLKTLVQPLKKRDFNAAQNVDVFIANSTGIQADIEEFYQRKSTVIFPPIDASSFSPLAKNRKQTSIPKKPRCLIWGRIVPMKRLDIAIKACQKLGWQLDIIGKGPDVDNLKNIADKHTNFLGFVDNTTREKYIKKADLLSKSVFFIWANNFLKSWIARLPTIEIFWLEQNNIIVFIINFL
jgi:glycosyltransferase involved in cell wall biosynthesis